MSLSTTEHERGLAIERARTYPAGFGQFWGVVDGEGIEDPGLAGFQGNGLYG